MTVGPSPSSSSLGRRGGGGAFWGGGAFDWTAVFDGVGAAPGAPALGVAGVTVGGR